MQYAKVNESGELAAVVDDTAFEGRGIQNDDGTWTLGAAVDDVAAADGFKPFDDAPQPDPLPGQVIEPVVEELATKIKRTWKVTEPAVADLRNHFLGVIDENANQALQASLPDVIEALEAGRPVPTNIRDARAAIRTRRGQIESTVRTASLADLRAMTPSDLDPAATG